MTDDAPQANETLQLQAMHSLKVLDSHPDVRFDKVTRLARRIFDVETSLVWLFDPSQRGKHPLAGLDPNDTCLDMSFGDHVFATEDTIVVPDAHADARFASHPLVVDEPFIRFYAGWPIHDEAGQAIGTLCLIDREPREFSDEDLGILSDLASMVETEFAALSQATMDQLTHLANRRGFMRAVEHLLPILGSLQVPVSLVAFDLDGLKTLNDSMGHLAGDELIKNFARLLLKGFRRSDVVARLGGDEFCVLVSGAEAEHVASQLDELRQTCADAPGQPIEFSAGVVAYDPEAHPSIDALCEAADAAMYREKQARKKAKAQTVADPA